MNEANSENEYKAAAEIFKTVPGFKDADSLVEKCLDNAETCRKDALYHSARSQMSQNTISSYESAIRMFESIPGWKDADEQIYACKKKIEELKAKQEADRLERERIEEKHRIAAEKAKKKIKKIITITAPIVCVLIVFLILLKTVIIPKQKYNAAVAKYGQEYVDAFYALNVGDTLVFGTYEQDNDTTNGKEDIEWLVLTKENNKILVVSDKALDCKPYNQSRDYVTWETCSLRNWLNNDFINAAFTAEERAMIPTVTVSADMNPEYNTNPGNATKDRVFLLSIVETEKYFTSDEARKCVPTEYAISNGAYTSDSYTKGGKVTCCWWLRSPGNSQSYAAYVLAGGSVYGYGHRVNNDYTSVRPALWISIDG